ncbi:MAG: hypothetical protein SFY81_01620 [Verrucomicrobiota bacterium]|nr:hypothetical protein [Verrucomicrobiota bacterium]
MTFSSNLVRSGLIAAGLLAGSTSSHAIVSLVYELDRKVTSSPVSVNETWLRATFTEVSSTRVDLVLEAVHLDGGFLGNWWFNYSGSPSDLNMSVVSKTGTFGNFSLGYQSGSKKINGFGNGLGSFDFDFNLTIKNNTGANRFDNNDSVRISFIDAGGINASDFALAESHGLFTMAHVQGVGCDEDSVKIGDDEILVPETKTTLAGIFLLGGVLALERVRRKAAAPAASVSAA